MSATPSKDTLNKFKSEGGNVLTLFQRYHGHPLPSPKIIRAKGIFIYIKLMKRVGQFLKQKMPLFIFTPTIKECELTSLFLSLFFKNGTFVHSQCVDREERIQKFKSNKYSYLVTTAVLERGVTVSNLQVIVFKADSFIYDSYSLIQIAGRVGRKKEAPNGEVIFLVKTITNDVQEACNEINKINTNM